MAQASSSTSPSMMGKLNRFAHAGTHAYPVRHGCIWGSAVLVVRAQHCCTALRARKGRRMRPTEADPEAECKCWGRH